MEVYVLNLKEDRDDYHIVLGVYSTRELAWAAALKHDNEYPGSNWYRVDVYVVDKT